MVCLGQGQSVGGRSEGIGPLVEHQDQEEEQGREANDERPRLAADVVPGSR